jgi:hypothetical protein
MPKSSGTGCSLRHTRLVTNPARFVYFRGAHNGYAVSFSRAPSGMSFWSPNQDWRPARELSHFLHSWKVLATAV